MFSKTAVLACIAASSLIVNATPENVEARQIESAFNSLTSAAASAITGDGASIISKATSVAGAIGSDVTSIGAGLGEYVTSEAGHLYTVVTSIGGPAITLAGSAAGVATSFGGSVFTAATSAAGAATSNAAVGSPSFGLTSSHFFGLATVVASALVGAAITF